MQLMNTKHDSLEVNAFPALGGGGAGEALPAQLMLPGLHQFVGTTQTMPEPTIIPDNNQHTVLYCLASSIMQPITVLRLHERRHNNNES